MARRKRRFSKTGVYHVMLHGTGDEIIFDLGKYKLKFLRILEEVKEEEAFDIIAYCVMNNHVHIMICIDECKFSTVMKKISIRYAQYYNRELDRTGHVFRDRYKSEVVEDERYYMELIRYIHNNPVKIHIVQTAEQYRWSSINTYINGNEKKETSSGLISSSELKKMKNYFSTKEEFLKFHLKDDKNFYIDTLQDRNQRIYDIRKQLVEESYNCSQEVNSMNQSMKEELAVKMISLQQLTCSQIAECCNISIYRVRELRKEHYLLKNKD